MATKATLSYLDRTMFSRGSLATTRVPTCVTIFAMGCVPTCIVTFATAHITTFTDLMSMVMPDNQPHVHGLA